MASTAKPLIDVTGTFKDFVFSGIAGYCVVDDNQLEMLMAYRRR